MERKECEELILKKLEEIREIYKEYNPKWEHLSISIARKYILFYNESYGRNKETTLDCIKYYKED